MATTVLTCGLVAVVAIQASRDVGPVAPATVVVPAPTLVTLPITTPVLVPVTIHVPPPPVPPEPVLAPEPPARPLAVTPHLDAACVTGLNDVAMDSCSWSDGFPAISRDGSRIVMKIEPGDSGRGYAHVRIHFIDTRTSKVVKNLPIVTPEDADGDGELTRKARAKIVRRVASVQRELEGYRSLQFLGESHEGSAPDASEAPEAGVRAEFTDDAARLIDGGAVVWQDRFPSAREFPARTLAEDDPRLDDCYPTGTRQIATWWDPSTRRVLAQASYASGPCYCDDEQVAYVSVASAAPTGR